MRSRQGEVVELAVERLGAGGDGLAPSQGEPVFVPFTVPGDRMRARLGRRRGAGYEGRMIELIAAGSGRAAPPCRHFGHCGGCALQHLDRDLYQRTKLAGLVNALARVGIDTGAVEELRVVAPGRRRARLGLERPRDRGQPARVGFRERLRHDLVDLHQCLVLEPALFALVGPLRDLIPDLLLPGGNAEATLTRTDSGLDLLLESAAPPGLGALEALARFGEEHDLARIVWCSQRQETLVVQRRGARLIYSGVAVPFPPGAFVQASEAAENILVDEVVRSVGPGRPALDLYAGLGSFALALAPGGRVHAIEGDERAVAALAGEAVGMPGLTVERRDLARDPLLPEALARYRAAVFDPPRAGAARQAAALAAAAIETVVAVSCNPATFARDAARLVAGGFRLERVVPVDQFVWTPRLELVAVFRR